jgi:hypothetical protein
MSEPLTDPVDEVRRIRDEHAAHFKNDLEAIFQDLKNEEDASGRRFLRHVSDLDIERFKRGGFESAGAILARKAKISRFMTLLTAADRRVLREIYYTGESPIASDELARKAGMRPIQLRQIMSHMAKAADKAGLKLRDVIEKGEADNGERIAVYSICRDIADQIQL